MNYVIGSGPAGVSVAHALLARGLAVTLLDPGVTLESERLHALRRLSAGPPGTWPQPDLALLKTTLPALHGIPRKAAYGSDFPYRNAGSMPTRQDGVAATASHARGGLSAVWGGAVLPYRTADIADWPLPAEALADHYRAVLGFLPLSARHDNLETAFPLYTEAPESLNPSRQAAALLRDLDAARAELGAAGIEYGMARLALRASSAAGGGCIYCGMCLYGCPRQVIYSASDTLSALLGRPGFTYREGLVVEQVAEEGGGVRLLCRGTQDGERQTLSGQRVYVAAGVLETTKIMLSSIGAHGRALSIRDSQYFLFPLLRNGAVHGVAEESLHTLAQIFLELRDCGPGTRPAHLQVYTYNDFLGQRIGRVLGPLRRPLQALERALLARLLVVQGYLHSDDSSAIIARLTRGTTPELVLEAQINPSTRDNIGRVMKQLAGNKGHLRARPLSPLLQVGRPGQGAHIGGQFPMRRQPAGLETDTVGRLPGLQRVHIVDASVFPNIPSTTITLTVMANAHRIASMSGEAAAT